MRWSARALLAATLCLALGLAHGCAESEPDARVELRGYRPIEAAAMRARGWRTDFTRHSLPLESIRDGGVPRESFVPIRGVRRAQARDYELGSAEPVVVLRHGEEVYAWPVVHILRRELVLDELDDLPLAITFCSLCASARVFDRRLGARALELGVSGLVLDGNSLLYDRESESLWSQIDGAAVVGKHVGERLRALPALVVSFGELTRAHPDALVMLPPEPTPEPALALLRASEVASGEAPAWIRLPGEDPFGMVLVTSSATAEVAGPLASMENGALVLRDPTCATPFRAEAGRASPLLGAATAFAPWLDGRELSFDVGPRGVRDRETGSRWNVLGEAVEGPLAGARLSPLPQVQCFRHAAH